MSEPDILSVAREAIKIHKTYSQEREYPSALASLELSDMTPQLAQAVIDLSALLSEVAALDDGDERFAWKHKALFARIHERVDAMGAK